jgi:hypothetical protein
MSFSKPIQNNIHSVHKNEGWEGQFKRMLRWYEKFLQTDPGNFAADDIQSQHDVLIACFQNIYILKDWLHYSGGIPKKELNEFINRNIELQICGDICNGTKHFEMYRKNVDANFRIIGEYNPFHELFGPQNKIIILSGGHKFELKELALVCITLWINFIQLRDLRNAAQ